MGNCITTRNFHADRTDPIGTSVNGYVWSIGSLSNTDLIRGTDPYGKPAYQLMHQGGIGQMAEDLREHLKIELHQFDKELYEMHSLHPAQGKTRLRKPFPVPVVTLNTAT